MLLAYLTHAVGYYRRPGGEDTGEVDNHRHALRPVRVVYDPTLAAEFGPLALKAVREAMVTAGLSRLVVSRRVNRVCRCFKWAAGEELIPFDACHRLTAVPVLGKRRTTASEPEPVKPVAADHVSATPPFLSLVAGMVRFQQLTGCGWCGSARWPKPC